MRIIVTEFMDQDALSAFDNRFTVEYSPELVEDRKALLAAVADADGIIVRNRTQVDKELLDSAPKLKVVGRLGVGLDNIDMTACKKREVAVFPATGANAISVAEYVIAASLTLVRKCFQSTAEVAQGSWPRSTLGTGGELYGRTLGLYGFGGIAQCIAPRAVALGMDIIATDPYLPESSPAWSAVTRCTGDELIERADVLSLHVPLTESTRGLMSAQAIARMKPGAILINTSRGGVVDEQALVDALTSGQLGGAALDVFADEPLSSATGKKFVGVPNLILTPHISGVTAEGNVRVSQVTVRNVINGLSK